MLSAIIGLMLLCVLTLVWLLVKPSVMAAKKAKKRKAEQKKVSTAKRRQAFVSSSSAPPTPNPTDTETEEELEVPDELANFQLLTLDDIDPEVLERFKGMASNIPRPKNLFLSLAREVQDPKKLADVVKTDPEIAAKILRMVNSSYYCLSTEINSIQHAVVYLGAGFVKDIAIQVAIQGSIKPTDERIEKAYRQLWIASVVASTLALKLAQRCGITNGPELSTRALLNSIGNLATLTNNPEIAEIYESNPGLFNRIQYEQEQLGANSALVGSLVATQWKLPQAVENSIKASLNPMAIPPNANPASPEELRNLIYTYTTERLGELVAFHGLRDIGEVNFYQTPGCEFIYLPSYLKKARLESLLEGLHEPALRTSINTLIQQIAGDLE